MRRTPKRALLVGFAAVFAWTLSLRLHPLLAQPAPGAPAIAHTVAPSPGRIASTTRAPSQGPVQFHVVANSNAPDDQAAKLAVRSRTLATLAPALESASSEAQALRRARRLEPLLTTEADTMLRELGRPYDARVVVGRAWVPEKTWGAVRLPQGTYPTVTILLGQAKGQNWWCVVFPPLCLVNPTAAVMQNVPSTGPEFLGRTFPPAAGSRHVSARRPDRGPLQSFLGELVSLFFG